MDKAEEHEKREKKTFNFRGKAVKLIIALWITFWTLVIIYHVGIALFGIWFEADKTVLKNTAKAQEDIVNALWFTFNDFGRLEVRYDYSVRAYISKNNFMLVPYPDRDEAITSIGKAWCENKSIAIWYMPKVVLRDIQTGKELGSYRCLFGFVSAELIQKSIRVKRDA